MKILQISNRVPWPLNEGGTIGIYNFTKAFHQAGHELTLYCLDGLKHNTPIEEAKAELSKYTHSLYFHTIDTDIKVEDAIKHLLKRKSYNVSRFENGSFKSILTDLLSNNTYDVVQLEGTYCGPYLDLVKSLHSGITSMRMHNVEHEIWERLAANENNFFKKQYLKLLAKQLRKYEKKLLGKIDVLLCVTRDDADKFKALVPTTNCLVIPAGIDTDYWKYKPSANYTNWYHLGSLEWLPNREAVKWFLKDIFPGLRNILPGISFNLAGKGIDPSDFSPVSGLKIHKKVDDAYSFVKSNDICVVPLLSGSGIRLKILEAMAAGKLVISTGIGMQGIDATDRVHCLIADTSEEFEAIAGELREGKIDIPFIVANARKLIEAQYSISAASKKLMDFYEKSI